LKEALGELGLPFSPAVLAAYRHINKALWEAYQRGEITPPALARERFRQLLAHLGADELYALRLSVRYMKGMAARGDLRPGSRALLRRLSGHYGLATVSNGLDRVQRARLRAAKIDGFFDHIVTSEMCGFAKPHPRIVEVALAALGVTAPDAILVGDDPEIDGVAAARAGVRFLWVDHGQKLRKGVRRPRVRIREWSDLLKVLGRRGGS
jgi:HAD superfamily hydrolase (TIGR01549 family)